MELGNKLLMPVDDKRENKEKWEHKKPLHTPVFSHPHALLISARHGRPESLSHCGQLCLYVKMAEKRAAAHGDSSAAPLLGQKKTFIKF